MDKILVTGVAGFIGTNLAQDLLKKENNFLFGIDNFSSGSMSNLYPMLKSANFEFLEHNLLKEIPIKVDYIYHLAGCGDMKLYFEDKYNFINNSFQIYKNIIEYTQNCGAKLVLTTQHLDYQEKNKELFLYFDYLKLIENMTLELIRNNKLNCTIARLDTIYGEYFKKDDNRFIAQNLIKIFNGENINFEFDESYYFTYIKDVVENLQKLANSLPKSNIIDICNPNLYLKSDIINLMIRYAKSNSKLSISTTAVHHPNYKPTISENFNCNTQILQGVLNMVKWYKLMYFS